MKHLKLFEEYNEKDKTLLSDIELKAVISEHNWTEEQINAIKQAVDILEKVGLNLEDAEQYCGY